ncbi:hypothetical protein [Bradyrhizobium yuanmingense]|uniref:hypothetical protein n=1 Tax=Bradyrhizobium yuanmingense TaxID=108015 RepID=UPI0023B89F57|nr:hypothetical protein [Bradyrhizobium yuanmingense]MDF0581182.1 hypothetical protein [Bradyrhizobium yuanmingense]
MKDFSYAILMIVLGWAIPLVLAWVWPKIKALRENPFATNLILSLLFAISISMTAILIYDRFFVPRNVVVFASEGGACPSGYRDNLTALIATWKGAPERFQVPKDINTKDGPISDGNWPWDHIKICLRE